MSLILSIQLVSFYVFADATQICSKNNYAVLNSAINSNVDPLAILQVKNFLVDLYKRASIIINEDQIAVTSVHHFFLIGRYDLKVTIGTSSNLFYAEDYNYGVHDVVATDNAEYDSLGNLIKPATEVTCSGVKSYQRTINVYNSTTNHNVGTTTLPDTLTCDASMDQCDVPGTVVIPI